MNERSFNGAGPDVGAFERGALPPGRDAALVPKLLRNAEWPATGPAEIFSGTPATCPPPLALGCATPEDASVGLDPFGMDCDPAGVPPDDDVWVLGFVCGTADPDASVLSDATRPLVFYQVDGWPAACDGLRLTKTPGGTIRIDCS